MEPPLTRAEVARRLRATAFAPLPAGRRARIGAEVELISLEAASLRVASVARTILPFLRAHAHRSGWAEQSSAKGAPRFLLPGGGAVTLEPGGQIEYATPPFPTPRALLDDLDAVVPPLIAAAAEAGLTLLGVGIDPENDLAAAPLQLDAERYRAMDAYFGTIGAAGARMMRQTAAIQVSIDAVADHDATWRVLNAAAPFVGALFANSARYAGADSAVASMRALTWRTLDPQRTGILPCAGDVADEYAGFALWAPAMFLRTEDGAYLPFCEWVRRGVAGGVELDAHLTTLFPEVRPKGYFEVRAIDALAPFWYAAPILLIAGLVWDERALADAAALLGAPDAALLDVAARGGLADARIGADADALFGIALDGCAQIGVAACGAEWLERAAAYRRTAAGSRAHRPSRTA
jgi:glutamate--cysteine ligase